MQQDRNGSLIEQVVAKAKALAPGERLRIPTLFANGITMGRTTAGHLFYVDGCTPMCQIRRRGDGERLLREALESALAERNANRAYEYRKVLEQVAT